MTSKRISTLAIVLMAFGWTGCGPEAGQEQDESFAKYGQEFEGKIAESYAESE
jgi:hypothetical protein